MFLVAVVIAIVSMITSRAMFYTLLRGVTSEFIELTRCLHARITFFFVLSVPTIKIPIANFFFRYAKFRMSATAPEVVRLTFSVICMKITPNFYKDFEVL